MRSRRYVTFTLCFLGGHRDAVLIILQRTGNVLIETFEGEIVLLLATGLELVRYLVEEGADIHAKDLIGRTSLHVPGC